MEFWIYIVISVIGILIISLVAFLIRCFGYKKVIRKMRTLSMNSNQSHEDAESGRRERATMPAPPPYSICLQHPVIARSTATTHLPTDGATNRSDLRPEVVTEDDSTDTTSSEGPFCSAAAFPAQEFFVPPPYCLDPPAYCEVLHMTTQSGDVTDLGEPPLFSAQ